MAASSLGCEPGDLGEIGAFRRFLRKINPRSGRHRKRPGPRYGMRGAEINGALARHQKRRESWQTEKHMRRRVSRARPREPRGTPSHATSTFINLLQPLSNHSVPTKVPAEFPPPTHTNSSRGYAPIVPFLWSFLSTLVRCQFIARCLASLPRAYPVVMRGVTTGRLLASCLLGRKNMASTLQTLHNCCIYDFKCLHLRLVL